MKTATDTRHGVAIDAIAEAIALRVLDRVAVKLGAALSKANKPFATPDTGSLLGMTVRTRTNEPKVHPRRARRSRRRILCPVEGCGKPGGGPKKQWFCWDHAAQLSAAEKAEARKNRQPALAAKVTRRPQKGPKKTPKPSRQRTKNKHNGSVHLQA